jgi:type II secretory pathway pseudopilin PulG
MKNGFTIFEALITTSIILILTSIVIANYWTGESILELQRATNKLAQDIKIAMNLAMGGKIQDTQFPKGGYGIFFPANTNQYILFGDKNGDLNYQNGEEIEILDLKEKRVKIDTTSPSRPFSILFFPPDPTITINPDPGTPYEARIILDANGKKMGVKINKAGVIEIFNL